MIICRDCDEVLYFGVMPSLCAEYEFVTCSACQREWDNHFENMVYDWANDR